MSNDVKEFLIARSLRANKNGGEFLKIFKVALNDFWHPLRGFDVTRFDDYLKCPDGISLVQHIESQYGERAKELIKGLL